MGVSSALGSSALLPAGLGFRNKIINGDMRVAQRGTSVTTSGAYTLDRWAQVSGNSIVHTQSTDTPNASFLYSLSMAGTGTNIVQRIESLNCGGINGTITVSFWYKSTVGSDALSFALYTCNTADSFGSLTQVGSNITISSSPSSSWTYYSYTFTGVSSNSKNGVALYIFRGSGATSTTFVTGVQLEANSQPTPFEQRPIGVELALCQRYYQRVNGSSSYSRFGVGTADTATIGYVLIPFFVPMRTTSTASQTLSYSAIGASGNRLYLSDGTAITNLTSLAIGTTGSERNLSIQINTASGLTTFRTYYLEETSTGDEWIAVSVEL